MLAAIKATSELFLAHLFLLVYVGDHEVSWINLRRRNNSTIPKVLSWIRSSIFVTYYWNVFGPMRCPYLRINQFRERSRSTKRISILIDPLYGCVITPPAFGQRIVELNIYV